MVYSRCAVVHSENATEPRRRLDVGLEPAQAGRARLRQQVDLVQQHHVCQLELPRRLAAGQSVIKHRSSSERAQ